MKAPKLCIAMLALCGYSGSASQLYNLVQGIDKFDGSSLAWHLLETNGFVVADPVYKHIIEPYLDNSLPPFITTDSAWETYQALIGASLKQLESKNRPAADFFARIETKIQAGSKASGLDLFVAASELRSPAAMRALRQLSGRDVEQAAENLNDALPSDSLSAKALRVLATIQTPVSGQLAPAFLSQAWSDEQLWMQLGAWAELSLPRQSHDEISAAYAAAEEAPKNGAVAPYPNFYSGLAQLSRETEAAMVKAGMDESFDSKAIAQELLDAIFVQQSLMAENGGEMPKMSAARLQFDQFAGHYMATHHAGGDDNSPAAVQMLRDLEAVARRCVAGGVPSLADLTVLHSFFDERMTAPRLMRDFAATCDRLSELARKEADGTPLTEDDEKWIAGYGITLARFHFFPDLSHTGSEADFPVTGRLGANTGASGLWAGLGQPEALYIILPAQGRLRLYRGAVLSYREFHESGSNSSPQAGSLPPPPAFTANFRAEESAADILSGLATEPADGQSFDDVAEKLEMLQSRATDADLPALIRVLARDDAMWSRSPGSSGIAAVIAKLDWEPLQKDLLALIDKNDGAHAGAVASILLQHPEWLDSAFLSATFDQKTARTRRVCALLLGRVRPTEQSRAALLRDLRDDAPGVRWQAVLALGDVSWDVAQKIPPLLDRVSDTNDFVAALAAHVLGKIEAAGVAPILFSNLAQRLEAPAPGAHSLQQQRAPVMDYALETFGGQSNPFDPEHLLARGPLGRMMRFPANVRRDQFTIATALIEALGDLHYQPAADKLLGLLAGQNACAAAQALKKISPEKLAERLVAVAADKNAPPQARADAMVLLGDNAPANPIAGLVPLLDDHTTVPGQRVMPGREWRICDQAATTLAMLMGRAVRLESVMPTEQRDEEIERVRQWLKSAY